MTFEESQQIAWDRKIVAPDTNILQCYLDLTQHVWKELKHIDPEYVDHVVIELGKPLALDEEETKKKGQNVWTIDGQPVELVFGVNTRFIKAQPAKARAILRALDNMLPFPESSWSFIVSE